MDEKVCKILTEIAIEIHWDERGFKGSIKNSKIRWEGF
jgi:hypothetical protein